MSVPSEVEELIAGGRLSAHLATAVDDRPHVAPVWYLYDGGTLSVVTGGRKLRNVRRNPRVSVSIERSDDEGVDWTVTLLGTATAIDDPDRIEAFRREMHEKYYGAPRDDPAPEGWALVEIEVGSATYDDYR